MGYGNGGMVGGSTGYAPPVQQQGVANVVQSAVAGQTQELAQQIQLLHQNLDSLGVRLEAVSQPSSPQPQVSAPNAPSHSVPYVRALTDLTMQLMAANQRLSDMITRVEL